ncbi:MAG: hypothetical protein QXE31_05140, partial [Candidatus Woesearchaeota archaeon]
MKNFIKKNYKKILILLLIYVMLFFYNFPLNTKPNQYDTYVYMSLANDINNKGYIQWTLSPLSLTGFYPNSYQTGGILFLSVLKSLLALDYEPLIFIFDFFSTIYFSIIIYLFLKKLIKKTNYFLYILSLLIFLFSKYVLGNLNLVFHVRSVFLMFFLIIIYILFLKFKNKKILFLILFAFSIILHRMFILIFLILFSYYLSKVIFSFYINKKYENYAFLLEIFLFFSSIILFFISINKVGIIELGQNLTIYDISTETLLGKIVITLIRIIFNTGFYFIFSIIGFFYLIFKKNKNFEEIFILLSFYLFIPLLSETTYLPYLLTIFYVLILIIFIYDLIDFNIYKIRSNFFINGNNYFYKKIIFIFFLFLIILPLFIQFRPNIQFFKKNEINYYNYKETDNLKKFLVNNLEKDYKITCNSILYLF